MPEKVKKSVVPVPDQDKLQFSIHEKKRSEIKEKDIFEKDQTANYHKNQTKLNESNVKKGFKIKTKEEEAKVVRRK